MKYHYPDAEIRLSFDEAMEAVEKAVQRLQANNDEMKELVERLQEK